MVGVEECAEEVAEAGFGAEADIPEALAEEAIEETDDVEACEAEEDADANWQTKLLSGSLGSKMLGCSETHLPGQHPDGDVTGHLLSSGTSHVSAISVIGAYWGTACIGIAELGGDTVGVDSTTSSTAWGRWRARGGRRSSRGGAIAVVSAAIGVPSRELASLTRSAISLVSTGDVGRRRYR
jgi:hypothetical protein